MDLLIKSADELVPLIEDILNQGKIVRFVSTGNSMWPFLRHNDTVEISAVSSSLRRGAILLAKLDDLYVMHRLYCRDDKGIYLLGDSRMEIEGPLMPEAVIGEVLTVQRGHRWRVMNRGFWLFLGIFWMSLFPLRRGMLPLLRLFAKPVSYIKAKNRKKDNAIHK